MLHLFLNNPEKSFYVREITRLIDEQINSVRRELANMLNVGVIVSDSVDNKLYYEVNQQYEYYTPLRAIFADQRMEDSSSLAQHQPLSWLGDLMKLSGLRLVVAAGKLVRGSASEVDLLLVGAIPPAKVANTVKKIEKIEGRELNYAVLSYDDFYYRMSVRDKFITEILSGRYSVLVDTENVLK